MGGGWWCETSDMLFQAPNLTFFLQSTAVTYKLLSSMFLSSEQFQFFDCLNLEIFRFSEDNPIVFLLRWLESPGFYSINPALPPSPPTPHQKNEIVTYAEMEKSRLPTSTFHNLSS